MCTDHTSYDIWLIEYSDNLVSVVGGAKSTSARGRELIKGRITSVFLSQRAKQGKVCDPRELCPVTPHPIAWKTKEKQGGGRGWTQTHRHAAGHQSSAGVEANPASEKVSGRRQCRRKEKRKPH